MKRQAHWICGLALLTIGCGGVPESPEWDVVVAAPFDSDRLSIEDFLPAGVDTTSVEGQKSFTLPEVSAATTLGLADLCPTCPSGTVTTVPGFAHTDSMDIPLTAGVVQILLSRGEAVVDLTNRFGFTLLGETGDGSGAFEVIALDLGSGAELGRGEVSGAGTEWDPDEVLQLRVPLDGRVITEGLRLRIALVSPEIVLTQPVDLDAGTGFSAEASLRSLAVGWVTVQVDGVGLSKSSQVQLDLDQGAEDVIDERVLGADIEFELQHDVAIDGPFRVTIADSRAALFSGDPLREITLGDFTFVSGVVQKTSMDAPTLQRLLDFPEQWIGYSAVGTGTLSDPPGHGPLSRFTPQSGFATRVRISTRFRVGGAG